jgi:hypothetical protein
VECGDASPRDIMNEYTENKIVCVQNCKDLTNYKYKYINRCYIECPQNSIINTETFICEKKETITSNFLDKQITTIPEIKTSAIIPTTTKEIPKPPKTSTIIPTTQIEEVIIPKASTIIPTTQIEEVIIPKESTIIPTTQIEKANLQKTSTIIPSTQIEKPNPTKISTIIPTTLIESPNPAKTLTIIQTTLIENPKQIITSIMIPGKVDLTTLKKEKTGTIETNLTILCDTNEFFLGTCENIYQTEEDKDSFRQNIIDDIRNGNLNDLLSAVIRENKVILIQEESEKYQISTISGQIALENLTSIDFGEC